MNGSTHLRRVIGQQKTLVIACIDCRLDVGSGGNGRVFVYTTVGNILQEQEVLQRELIQYYVEREGCSQIVVAGHSDCRAIDYLLGCLSPEPAVMRLKVQLQKLVGSNHGAPLGEGSAKKLLVELNVIQQGRVLMEYDFIRKRVGHGWLRIVGLVTGQADEDKTVFRNGVSFNDHASLN